MGFFQLILNGRIINLWLACRVELLLSGDTLDGDGGADLAATARIRNGWMNFPRAVAISDIQRSPVGDEWASVCQLC